MTSPFFIVGCGRSGTTLLRAMLNRHSQVAVPPEGLFVADYLTAGPQVPISRLRFLAAREYELKEWGLRLAESDLADVDAPAEVVARVHRLYAQRHGKVRWGHKTPRLVRYWKSVRAAFPEAKFVHVVRDPRATVASLVASEVHQATVPSACRRWIHDVEHGLQMESAHDEKVLRVHFEDLVRDPDEVIPEVCEFIDVPFEERMLNPDVEVEEQRVAYYLSIHRNLSRRPDPSRVDAWRESLSDRDVAYIEQACEGLMLRLGYKTSHAGPAPGHLYRVAGVMTRLGKALLQAKHYARHRGGYPLGYARRKLTLVWVRFRRLVVGYLRR